MRALSSTQNEGKAAFEIYDGQSEQYTEYADVLFETSGTVQISSVPEPATRVEDVVARRRAAAGADCAEHERRPADRAGRGGRQIFAWAVRCRPDRRVDVIAAVGVGEKEGCGLGAGRDGEEAGRKGGHFTEFRKYLPKTQRLIARLKL